MEKIINKYISVIGEVFYNNSDKRYKTREKVEYKNFNVVIGKNTIIEPGVMIYPNVIIGESCILGSGCVIKSDVKIGDHTIIGDLSTCEGNNIIGEWTTVNCQCCVGWGLHIGNKCFIAPFFHMANTKSPGDIGCNFGYPNTTNSPRDCGKIEDCCQIGEDVGLAPGVVIGENSVVDMHCLLTKNIPPNSKVRAGREIVGKTI